MLGLGAIAEITPAGSPPSHAAGGDVMLTEPGVITLTGNASLSSVRRLPTTVGTISLAGMARLGQHRSMQLARGQLDIGGGARLYKSAFFTGEPEIIRVPAEVRRLAVPFEPREMRVSRKPDEAAVSEPHAMSLPPRLRRT